MGKGKQAKREEKAAAEKEGEYEFELPEFDETAFMRREVASARASFYTIALGFLAGFLSLAVLAFGLDWRLGWLPIFASMVFLGPILRRAGFTDEIVAPKMLVGSYFMIFFTSLGIWIFGANFI